MSIDIGSFKDVDLEVLATLPPEPASVPLRDIAAEFFGSKNLVAVTDSLNRLRARGFDVITKNVKHLSRLHSGRREACITRFGWDNARAAAEDYMRNL